MRIVPLRFICAGSKVSRRAGPVSVLFALPACLVSLVGVLALSASSDPSPPASPTSESVAPEPAPVAAEAHDEVELSALASRARTVFGTLPTVAENPANPSTPERVALGRMLYVDERLSKNHDISCNTCHPLDNYGVDNLPFSIGHEGFRGGRNSPSSFNAAIHVAQFWDGRAADVEAQAKGPVLNPIEMAMPSAAAVETVLRSIPGYAAPFAAAFPDDAEPVSFDNMALAIGAFERLLMTPSRVDEFMAGDLTALTTQEQTGLGTFMGAGCIQCHHGPGIGGGGYQKIGLVNSYDGPDPGRMGVSGSRNDFQVFKVPSLRNVAKTAPYFHDASIKTLDEAVRAMAHLQLGRELTEEAVADIVAFLSALTGEPDPELVEMPVLPESGPTTPPPDPT